MQNTVFQFLNNFLSKELAVLITAALPVVELRGAIPLAMALGMPASKAFFLGVIGNIIPIIPLLLLLKPLTEFLTKHFSIFAKFFNWLHQRTLNKSDQVKRYGALGLIFFTAIPLPTTGAWTACIAAILFQIPLKFSFPAISLGVLLAGTLMTLISSGVF